MVFDTYQNLSLKAATRTKRGKGIRRKVLDDTIAPTNWNGFLRLNQNKTELFAYLSKDLMTCTDDDTVLTCAYATTCVTSSGQMASSFISPCNQEEEADTRVFAWSLQGHTKITIRTVGHRRLSYSYIHIRSFAWSTRRIVDRFLVVA